MTRLIESAMNEIRVAPRTPPHQFHTLIVV